MRGCFGLADCLVRVGGFGGFWWILCAGWCEWAAVMFAGFLADLALLRLWVLGTWRWWLLPDFAI